MPITEGLAPSSAKYGSNMKPSETLRRATRPSESRGTAFLVARSSLNAVLFFVIFMIAVPWLAHWLLPMPLPLPRSLGGWPAGALALAGFGIWISCLAAFSRTGRGTPRASEAPRHLVTAGPYAVVRNPMMVGELAVIWAEALYVSSTGVALYALAMTGLAHWLVLRVEEPELLERFGDAYAAYCKRVPRWIPRRHHQDEATRVS